MAHLAIFSKACNLIFSGRLLGTNRLGILQPQIQSALFSESAKKSEGKPDVVLPQKPKRPLMPFFRYITEHRPVLASQHPKCKAIDLIKKCAEDWKKVQSDVKEKYQLEYETEMKDYSKKFMEYSSQLTPEQKQAIKEKSLERREHKKRKLVKKKSQELDKPKRPLQPYTMFVKEQLVNRDVKLTDSMKILGAEWKMLPEDEKVKYKDSFVRQNVKYEMELRDWERKMLNLGNADLVRKSTLEKLDVSERRLLEGKSGRHPKDTKGANDKTKKTERKTATKRKPHKAKGASEKVKHE